MQRIWVLGILLLIFYNQIFSQISNHPGHKIIFPIFWTWQDEEIENHNLLKEQIKDIKKAGFGGVYAAPRATRYHLFNKEMTASVVQASKLAQDLDLEFIWCLDPRFAATHIVSETGYGAEMLMVNEKFIEDLDAPNKIDLNRFALNETKLENGRYSLRYNYPTRRDLHMLTEVGLYLNPINIEKVYAYQRHDGKVIRESIKDITDSSHFFINRSFHYVEIFGNIKLPEGEWWIFAFPRFMTNMYAYDSPEHERLFSTLLHEYKLLDIHFDGFWWDEPGYYFQFGHFVISDRVYQNFKQKYGYDLKDYLFALTLCLDDDSHIKVRNDYFSLLMDYVFGSEQRFWELSESIFGPLRMGDHFTWHDIHDDMYAGVGDYWRGLKSVDGGYTDSADFERYFTAKMEKRYEYIAEMMLAKSLAKFSLTGKAHYNQWGQKYGPEVPIYWNDLMALFSNEWIQHCYGYTGVIGAERPFGPGFPNHETWSIMPQLNARSKQILEITDFKPPIAEVAIVYPIPTLLSQWGPENYYCEKKVHQLLGMMPALGIQADAISVDLFASGKLENEVLEIHNQKYKAVLWPFAKIITPDCISILNKMKESNFPLYFGNQIPLFTTTGEKLQLNFPVSFNLDSDIEAIEKSIEKLILPSPISRLKGAYTTVVSGKSNEIYLLVMPIEPGKSVSGKVNCLGNVLNISNAKRLQIYKISPKERVTQIFK